MPASRWRPAASRAGPTPIAEKCTRPHSLFLGLDSIIGPLYLAYGKTFGGDSAFYLFLGRPANRVQ